MGPRPRRWVRGGQGVGTGRAGDIRGSGGASTLSRRVRGGSGVSGDTQGRWLGARGGFWGWGQAGTVALGGAAVLLAPPLPAGPGGDRGVTGG